MADTATINFSCETGWLDLKTAGSGDLSASGGRGVFSGDNTTLLRDATGQVETSTGTVTVNMTGINPSSQVNSGLSIVIEDDTTTVTLTIIDLFDDGFPDVVLTDGVEVDSAEFAFPNSGTNFMTLEYDPLTDEVTATIQGFMGNTATLSLVEMDNLRMGVKAANASANFGGITFTATDVPLFPPTFDPANPWVDFGASPCGNGGAGYPFNLLADAVAAADPGGTISMVPGTDGAETFVDASAIDTSLTLLNSDAGSGPVRVGVVARRATQPKDQATTGFVSRSR